MGWFVSPATPQEQAHDVLERRARHAAREDARQLIDEIADLLRDVRRRDVRRRAGDARAHRSLGAEQRADG